MLDLTRLLEHEQHASFRAGETLLEEGSEGHVMYVILSGEVEVVRGGELVDTCGVGEIVGEMALIDNSPRAAAVIARTDCETSEVSQKRFLLMVAQTPFFALHCMEVLARRLRATRA
ncbi:MAG: cyclic nucleotide-binding domain-containing protein [Gammaproteobacteria bacterium]|nr:cyclic nucleotide-binding domain-containing protein [Gammaproteobacteria bacterium]